MFELKMPQWGMNMTEGTITKWLKGPGEPVAKGEPLVEIETAKAIATLESPVDGIVTKLVANVQDTIQVQEVIAIIE